MGSCHILAGHYLSLNYLHARIVCDAWIGDVVRRSFGWQLMRSSTKSGAFLVVKVAYFTNGSVEGIWDVFRLEGYWRCFRMLQLKYRSGWIRRLCGWVRRILWRSFSIASNLSNLEDPFDVENIYAICRLSSHSSFN